MGERELLILLILLGAIGAGWLVLVGFTIGLVVSSAKSKAPRMRKPDRWIITTRESR